MGFTLKDFEDKAAEKYKGLPIDDDQGNRLFTFRPALSLSDAETAKLSLAQAALKEFQSAQGTEDPEAKPSGLRVLIRDVLIILADKTQAAKAFLTPLPLTTLMTVFTMYHEETQAAEGN